MSFRLVYEPEETLIAWAEAHLPGSKFRDDARAIGNEKDGVLRAVAVYDTFTTTSCLVHLVSDGSKKWMTREFITAGFAYPFVQCGFPRVTAIVSADNEEALRLNLHFGWVKEGVEREGGLHGEDNIILGMLRRECRWLAPALRRVPASL